MASKTTGQSGSTKAKATGTKKAAGHATSGLQKPLTPSANLAAVIGEGQRTRTEMVKKVWEYIRANHLQDETNKRLINADDQLKPLFEGKEQISMFDLAKVISKNVH